MEYLIKVSAILVLFYVCYKLFLNRETFFESNRLFLLVGIASAFLLPLITFTKYIEVEPTLTETAFGFGDAISQTIVTDNQISLTSILTYIYIAGVLFLLSRFLFQFGSLVLLFIKSTKQRVASYIYVITKNALSPFSFFNWIVFNPDHFNETELEQIITHEKVHAKQLHSIDILLVELISIILWFNPLIWLYKKDLCQNLEFIADKNVQATTHCKKSYQHLLLKTSAPNYQMALTNNFYNSLIKKRIVMLHKNKSNNRSKLKFLVILPALAVFLMSFNTKEIYIEKESNTKTESSVLDLNDFESSQVETYAIADKMLPDTSIKAANKADLLKSSSIAKQDIAIYFIESTFTDAQLDNVITKLKAQGVSLKIKGVKRNSGNEITALKIDAKSNKSNANFSIDNDAAIKTIRITYNAKDNSISIGNTNRILHDKDYEYIHEDGIVTIKKSGKSNNVFVLRSANVNNNEDSSVITADSIRFNGNVKLKDKNIFVISEGDKVVDLQVDSSQAGTFIIKKDNKGHTIKGNVIKEWKDEDGKIFIHRDDDNDGNVIIKSTGNATLWTDDNDENVLLETLGKGKNKIFISTNGKKDGLEDPLYIIDDKEVAKKDLDDVDPNNIASVNVLKGEAATKLYGNKGKDGVVLIYTKGKNSNPKINNSVSDLKFILDDTEIKDRKYLDTNILGKNALLIVDGKETRNKKLDQIDTDNIASVFVLTGEVAIKKYGDKGKNGVIVITTKNKKD